MSDEKLPPLPPIPPPPVAPPELPPLPPKSRKPAKRSKSGAFRHLKGDSSDRLQDFARTGFAGYRKVAVADKRRGPAIAWFIIGTLVLVAAGLALFQWLRAPAIEDVAPDTLATVDGEPVALSRIDPEAWRSDLESLEGFLFASAGDLGPLNDFGTRFRQEADIFVDRLRADGGAKEDALADALAGLVDDTERSDFNVRRLKNVRRAWLDLRELRLAEAEWLTLPDESLDQEADLEVYRQAAEQIQGLLSDTLATAEDLSTAGLSSKERREEWRQTLFYFRDDLKVIRAALPRRPGAETPSAELDAIHRLDRIFIEAEGVASAHQNLSNLNRSAFDLAIENAEEAAAFFDRRLGS